MTRAQLEHIIRAAAAITNEREIVVIGSQSLLGSFPSLPSELTQSMEADVFPLDQSHHSIAIDGAIGELSLFHETFGYYAHGVDESTATLPDGWRDRLVRVATAGTAGAIGWCLEPHDLAFSKLAAGRPKVLDFARGMIRAGLVQPGLIRARAQTSSTVNPEQRRLILERLHGIESESHRDVHDKP